MSGAPREKAHDHAWNQTEGIDGGGPHRRAGGRRGASGAGAVHGRGHRCGGGADQDARYPRGARSTIYLSHNRSLLEEAFFHLRQLVAYADYDQRLSLRKLQSLKANKGRYDRGEIEQGQFEALAERADRVHAQDLDEARDYLAGKAERLHAICTNLSQNVQELRNNLAAAQMSALPRGLAGRVTALQSHRAWVDFTTPTEVGQQMRLALEQSETGDSQAIVSCLADAFAAYEASPGGAVIDAELVRDVVSQFQ